MPRLVKPSETNDDGMNDTHIRESDHGGDDSLDTGERTHELRIWPPPRLQGYCVDHFLMECENYYEQENDRYNKLVTHSRQTFLEIQKKKNPSTQLISAPTRLQPSRRAKEKHLVLGTTPTTIPEATTAQGPQGHKGPLNLQFKPARLEKAFRESRQGAMLSILTEFHKKLELQKSWEDYRSSFEIPFIPMSIYIVHHLLRKVFANTRYEDTAWEDTHELCLPRAVGA
ncbi:hypothetical protein GQX73_g1914 [Xylaria multiplex]|uniref:Uncharacterized protein n=1 Tax=Xylaria multiplex TaxID=323545 RepID=A0A7C8IT84_9PEZI|nr:hypothetical protein GQX73_g1914 [Xylaria multiplex]